eukprot:539605_1
MKILEFRILTFYLITNIICNASCPCHIPCSSHTEICTCYGPCGEDGYGCESNGDDYRFYDEIQCREGEWQIECIRQGSCDIATLDDTSTYSEYERLSSKLATYGDDSSIQQSSAKSAMSWFGGNWFDMFGQNEDDFFANDIEEGEILKNNKDEEEDITIDNKNYDSFSEPQYSESSPQRSLQAAVQKQVHKSG